MTLEEKNEEVTTTKPRLLKKNNKNCPLTLLGADKITYKNPKLLFKFVSERGRILPRRITLVSAKMQRILKNEIKKARTLALMPFASS